MVTGDEGDDGGGDYDDDNQTCGFPSSHVQSCTINKTER